MFSRIVCVFCFLVLENTHLNDYRREKHNPKFIKKKEKCVYCIRLKCTYLLHEAYSSNVIDWNFLSYFNSSNLSDRLFCCEMQKNAAKSGFFNQPFDGIVAVAELGGSEIDRSGGGESFAAMRHLNWLNADKLQRYTHFPRRSIPPRFFCAFSRLSPPSPHGRLAIWKFPAGRMCRSLRGVFYVSDAISRLQWTASWRSLRDSLSLLFLLLSDAIWV